MFGIQVSSSSLFYKIHANKCMNNKGFFLQLKYMHTGEITSKCVNYQISKLYTHVITRTVHKILHAFYMHVGAVIHLTRMVYGLVVFSSFLRVYMFLVAFNISLF